MQQQRAGLLQVEDSGDAAAATVELDQSRVGRLSRMDALQSQAMSLASQQRRRQSLRLIDAALGRIEEGEYGYCLECGEQIPAGRLNFAPETAYCIDCAEKRE